jgi:hypothetical protein
MGETTVERPMPNNEHQVSQHRGGLADGGWPKFLPMAARSRVKVHLLLLVGFNVALFLPMVGHGFVVDDFQLLAALAFHPFSFGLTHAHGAFYTPLTWMWYKADWSLWGMNAFPFALGDLVVYIANALLLYRLALTLYQDESAAGWTALGFSLLFSANPWAAMWISTRAHVLVAFFYLAALNVTLWFTRTNRYRLLAGVCVFLLAAGAMFSKEDGITVILAIAIVIFYEKQLTRTSSLLLLTAFLILLAAYFWLRAGSGAEVIDFNEKGNYPYHLSFGVLIENLGLNIMRTHGCLGLIATAIAISYYLQTGSLNLLSFSLRDALLSIALFLVVIAPFLLLRVKLGIYVYLAGACAALLLGAFMRALNASRRTIRQTRRSFTAEIPVIFIVLMLAARVWSHSHRWMKMADTSTAVLSQIKAQVPTVHLPAAIVLRYSKVDKVHRFPDNFGTWTFPSAMQLLYRAPTLKGFLVQQAETVPGPDRASAIYFTYVADAKSPTVRKTDE